MKILNLSGGATKAAGEVGAARYIMEDCGYMPDIISGISAGAVLSLPIALASKYPYLWPEIKKMSVNLEFDSIFSVSPLNKKGTGLAVFPGGLFRILRKKESLGVMGNLKNTLRKLVTCERFLSYCNPEYGYPDVYVGSVDVKTGNISYLNLKDLSYEEALDKIVASSSIPIIAETVKIQSGYHLDGGLRDNIGSVYLLNKFGKQITECVSIYSRPKQLHQILDENWVPKDIFKVVERTVDILMLEISKSDELIETLMCEQRNIKRNAIFVPKVLEELLEVDTNKLQKLYYEGYKAAVKQYKP